MTAIIAYTLRTTGLWPFVSYTAISYGLLTLRFTFISLGLLTAAEILRFPVVAMATVTSTVWWLVLPLGSLVAASSKNLGLHKHIQLSHPVDYRPILHPAWSRFPIILADAAAENRRAFLRMNFSVFLLNMHLLNLPMALASQWSYSRALCFLDFWVAAVVAMLYLFFYLLVMDANGLHLYIILSLGQDLEIVPRQGENAGRQASGHNKSEEQKTPNSGVCVCVTLA